MVSLTPCLYRAHQSIPHTHRSAAEKNQGRRLVRFSRKQIGRVVTLSFELVTSYSKEDDDAENKIIISCLLPPEQKFHFITSVDFVRLISMLVNPTTKKLSIEEKNRVRRSLEVFQPLTLKKHEASTAGIFNYLMCLHTPRPFTIAKDIKMFEWYTLEDGLAKILAKYVSEFHAIYAHATDLIFT